jgi:hypothetical protein
MVRTSEQPSFRVGDRVRFDYGRRRVTGEIVEDYGPLGAGGRRLFQVLIPVEPDEPVLVALPEDEMEPVPPGEGPPPLDHAKVVEYLADGGLTSILRTNLAGPDRQPRVWLCPSQLGNVTHTFVAKRGVRGGQSVPYRALRGHRIARPKVDEVLAFLEGFGLSRPEAAGVVKRVGTVR